MIRKTKIYLGRQYVPALELPTDTETFRVISGGRSIMPPFARLENDQTIVVARSPDNENPASVYLLRKYRQIMSALRQDDYIKRININGSATVLRRLRWL